MNEEQKNLIIRELSKRSIENGGFVLKKDVLEVLGLSEDEGNKSTLFDDIINELAEHEIDYHEDAKQAIASEEPGVDGLTEEELEEENLEYPDMDDEDGLVDDDSVPSDFDIPVDDDSSDEQEDSSSG